jgi:hypothetical protein
MSIILSQNLHTTLSVVSCFVRKGTVKHETRKKEDSSLDRKQISLEN